MPVQLAVAAQCFLVPVAVSYSYVMVARSLPEIMTENILAAMESCATGHDQGHIAPRQSFSWHVCGAYQTFTMANMSPQRAFLNQDIWEALEQQVLTWAVDEGPIYVITGTTFRRFPHQRFEVYQDGTFDRAHIYSPGTTMSEVVVQHRDNFLNFPPGAHSQTKAQRRPKQGRGDRPTNADADRPLQGGVPPRQRSRTRARDWLSDPAHF